MVWVGYELIKGFSSSKVFSKKYFDEESGMEVVINFLLSQEAD